MSFPFCFVVFMCFSLYLFSEIDLLNLINLLGAFPLPLPLEAPSSSPCSSAVDRMCGIRSILVFRVMHPQLAVCQEGVRPCLLLSSLIHGQTSVF